jgi:phytanoyl-CoA hydroxylase
MSEKPVADNSGTSRSIVIDGMLVDAASAEPYDAGLYDFEGQAETVPSLADIDDESIEQYRRDGYIVIDKAFTSEQVEAAREGLLTVIQGQDIDPNKIQFETWTADRLSELSPHERLNAVRKFMDFTEEDERLNAIARSPDLLRVMSRLLNGWEPEILQEMALIKGPRGREKPWHQDRAYFDLPPETPIVGTWVALDEANPENGCMRILPGGHREGPIVHFQRRDWQICDTEMGGCKPVAVPLKPGGLLIFDPLLPHGTPHNATERPRWAVQFHYYPAGVEKIGEDTRLALFGSEGKNVEC